MSDSSSQSNVYALVAEYPTPEALLTAAEKVRDAGYKRVDALTPFPVHGIIEALGLPKSRMAALVFCAALLGAAGGFYLQVWLTTQQYPLTISGRPYFSWPNYIPVTFECMVLAAGLTAFFGMLIRNRLPRPYHPLFATRGIEASTTGKFMIVVESTDPKFDERDTETFLRSTGAESVNVAPLDEFGRDQAADAAAK